MSGGWIKLYRKSFNNELYFAEPFTKWQAWVDMLLLANHEENVITKRGIKIIVERGQIGYSEVSLAERWKWSRDKVRRFLKYLENGEKNDTAKNGKTRQQIRQQKCNTTTLITILNYEKYQDTIQQTIHQDYEKQYLNKNRDINLIVKQSSENEKKVNRDFGTGEAFIASRYGNGRPSSFFGTQDDNEGEV